VSQSVPAGVTIIPIDNLPISSNADSESSDADSTSSDDEGIQA
ncbi:unnamed protein product, partial [Auanema sp. JU1783]